MNSIYKTILLFIAGLITIVADTLLGIYVLVQRPLPIIITHAIIASLFFVALYMDVKSKFPPCGDE